MAYLRTLHALAFLFILTVLSADVTTGAMRYKRTTQKTKLPEDTYAIYNFDFQGNPSDIPGFSVPDPLSIPREYQVFSEFPNTVTISDTEFHGLSAMDIIYAEVDFINFSFHAAANVPQIVVLGNIIVSTDLLYTTSDWSSLYNITVHDAAIIMKGNFVIDEEGGIQINKEDMLFEVAYVDVELQADNLPFWAETLLEDSADMFKYALQTMIKDWIPEFLSEARKKEFSIKFPDTEDVVQQFEVKPRVTFEGFRTGAKYLKKLGITKILHCYDLALSAENTLYKSRNYEVTYKNNTIRVGYETEVELMKVTGKCRLLFLKPLSFEIQIRNYVTESEILFNTRKLSPPTMRGISTRMGGVVLTKPNLGELNLAAKSSVKSIPSKLWDAIQKKIVKKEHWLSLDTQLNSLKISYLVSNRLITLARDSIDLATG